MMGIPHCCGEALEVCLSVPSYEYQCPKCKAYYQFFDGFTRLQPNQMTKNQKEIAISRGWIIKEEPIKQ